MAVIQARRLVLPWKPEGVLKGEGFWLSEAGSQGKLDPGTNLYKNIQLVGTGLVWAKLRERSSVLSMKPTVEKQVGLNTYKHFPMSYKAEGSRQHYKVMKDITKAGNPYID